MFGFWKLGLERGVRQAFGLVPNLQRLPKTGTRLNHFAGQATFRSIAYALLHDKFVRQMLDGLPN